MHPLSLLLRMLKLFFDLLEAVFADTLAVEINNIVGIVAKNARGVVFHENYFSVVCVNFDGIFFFDVHCLSDLYRENDSSEMIHHSDHSC